MAIHTSFAEELARFENADNRFLALVRYNHDFHAALLNVKNRIGCFSLREDDLILLINRYCLSRPNFGEKCLRVEQVLGWLSYHVVSWPVEVRGAAIYATPIPNKTAQV
jgi:hypothetical protein